MFGYSLVNGSRGCAVPPRGDQAGFAEEVALPRRGLVGKKGRAVLPPVVKAALERERQSLQGRSLRNGSPFPSIPPLFHSRFASCARRR